MDEIDMQIIKELTYDSSQSNRSIGENLYISSQAISQRINKLKKLGIISKYTIEIDFEKLNKINEIEEKNKLSVIYVEVYLNSNNFLEFENFIKKSDNIISCEKIYGSYCYLIKYLKEDGNKYNNFILNIEKYARYKINEVSKRII